MRKSFWVGGLVAVLLLVGLILVFMWRPAPVKTEVLALPEVPLQPDVSLQVNGRKELVVFQGVPLIFSIRLANQQAMNADLQNETKQAYIEALQTALARGELPKEKVESQIVRLRQKEEIRVVRLGDERTGWEQFVHLGVKLPDGSTQSLPWPLKPVAPPQLKAVTLDADTTLQLDYAVEPAAAVQVSVGEYRLVAVLDVPAEASLPADRWRGRVESEPVKLSVVAKPASLALPDEEKMNLGLARYFVAVGEPSRALEHAQKILASNPRSIPAHTLVGGAKEAQGDLRGALAAYQNAKREFYQQYPKSHEPPLYLNHKISILIEKLEGKP